VTLSDEQLSLSRERAEKAGLSDKVRFDLLDYRDAEGPFDRIVSVGMFEHVGVNHYLEYFRKTHELLKPDGVMLLHTIGRLGPPDVTSAFIRKYIFPGGYIPALSEVMHAVELSGLQATDVEVLTDHYADTLLQWRERFMAQRDEAVALYDERFARMWEFYLAASEAAFRYQDMVVFQIQLTRNKLVVPRTRDYITDADRQKVWQDNKKKKAAG
jgi:cyclopropane-fatty-acyl-phospholipid synthase